MSKLKKPIDTSNFNPGDKCYVFKKNGNKLIRYFSYTDMYGNSYFTNSKENAVTKSAKLAWMFSSRPQVWKKFELIKEN